MDEEESVVNYLEAENNRTPMRPPADLPGFCVVCIGTSAGGLEALKQMLAPIPSEINAALLLVQHLGTESPNPLPTVLGRYTKLEVKEAEQGEEPRPGTILVGKPNYNMLVSPEGTVVHSQVELVHFIRPSVDLLFESAAAVYQAMTIAVVLSGTGSDGALGAKAVGEMGGTVMVQNYRTAEFDGMPEAVVRIDRPDYVLPLYDMPMILQLLVVRKTNDHDPARPPVNSASS